MPLVGITCPKHGNLSFKEAVSGKCDCTPRFLLDSIINVAQRDYHKGTIISATSLLGCLRETYLSRISDYYATVGQLYFSWRGTLIHKILERPNLENWIAEQIYTKQFLIKGKKVELSGKIDGYDKLTKTLWDIKTIGDRGLNYVIKDGAKKEHIEQTNIYRWLCPLEIKQLKVIYVSMMSFAQTGQVNEIIQKLKRPPTQKKSGFKYFTPPKEITGYDNYTLYYDTPEIPIWSEEETIQFIAPRIAMLNDAFEYGKLPPKCDEEMAKWKCQSRYCQVYDLCQKYEKEEKQDEGGGPK